MIQGFASADLPKQVDVIRLLTWNTFATLNDAHKIHGRGSLNARANELRLYLDQVRSTRRYANAPPTFAAVVTSQLEAFRLAVMASNGVGAPEEIGALTASFTEEVEFAFGIKSAVPLNIRLSRIAVDHPKLSKCDALTTLALFIGLALDHWTSVHGSEGLLLGAIQREIRFEPEHQQAGIAVLSYFSAILHQKAPSLDATVSISQHGDTVTLLIRHRDGQSEEITRLLSEYGTVIRGDLAPEEFLSNPLQALALKSKLELAQLEIRQTRELLATERSFALREVALVRSEVDHLRQLIASVLADGRQVRAQAIELVATHLKLTSSHSTSQRRVIDHLVEAIVNQNKEAVRQNAAVLISEDRDLSDRLWDFLMSSSFGGVIGNYAYDWLKLLYPILPK